MSDIGAKSSEPLLVTDSYAPPAPGEFVKVDDSHEHEMLVVQLVPARPVNGLETLVIKQMPPWVNWLDGNAEMT